MRIRMIACLIACLIACSGLSHAATSSPPWLQPGLTPQTLPHALELEPMDAAKLIEADLALDGKQGTPRRIGLVSELGRGRIGLSAKDSSWQPLADGRLLWRAHLHAPGARGLGFVFDAFHLPAGAELWIRRADGSDWLTRYTDADNPFGQRLYTPILAGDDAVIELVLPAAMREFVRLELGSVTRAYRDVEPDAFEKTVAAKSGSCNVDVACPEGNPWRDQINSVAHYTFQSGSGTFVCTGQLAATTNTANDTQSPTFLTAHHCVSSQSEASSMVFYWKYESPTCRTPGSAASGSPLNKPSNTAATQSGATLLATHAQTDFTVLRLNSMVPAAVQAFWSGWDRNDSPPTGSVTIHHPAGHEKRISFNDDTLTIIPSCILGGTPSNTHWRIDNWELGTTEGGSSGSGLWRPDNQRLIGVLSGGEASCSVLSFDCYGRLAPAWEGGGSSSSRVRDWLDPGGGTTQTLAGHGATDALTTTLSSSAFTTPASAGDTITLTASASGGSAPYTYEWDTDGDGVFERRSSSATLQLRYPARTSTQVTVRVTDSASAVGMTTRALDVRGPIIGGTAASGPTQVCGNGDGQFDPGERWRLPVRLSNTGDASMQAGHALFASSNGAAQSLPFGPDAFGHRASANGSGCASSWIDISAEPALGLTASGTFPAEDDGRAVITLQNETFRFYGQNYSQVVASTNGYLAFSTADNGGDIFSECDESTRGIGPRMQVLHADLALGNQSGFGIRYRRFASCPRAGDAGDAGQPCHVVTWSGAHPWDGSGNDEFQAVLYPSTGEIVYQYRTIQSTDLSEVVIGIAADELYTDSLNLSCKSTAGASSGSAYCIFEPASLGSGPTAVVLNQPATAFATLGNGASTTVNVEFDIDAGAACGSSLGIDYVGASDGARQSFNANSVLQTTVAASCTVSSACAPFDLTAPPRRGLYFNGVRPGNGMNGYFYDIAGNDRFFAGLWYTAGLDRNATWYLAAGEVRGYGGALPLSIVRNNATPPGVSTSESSVGRAWVGQIDTDSLLFAWQFDDGRSGIERMDTVAQGFPTSNNHTQAWYNPGESGWGVAIESLDLGGGQFFEFFADYIFDSAGNPRWVVGDKSSVSSGTAALLDVKTFCPGCAFFPDYNDFNTSAGNMSIQYSSRTNATLSTSILLPSPLSGSWNRTNLPFQALAEPTP